MAEGKQAWDWRSLTPDDSPMTPMEMMADPVVKDLATPDLAVGAEAFDFELPVFDFSDGTKRATGRTMRLLDVAGSRPVALIFGSYT